MSKRAFIILGIIILLIIPIYYFNSETYLLRLASIARDLKIDEYDKMEKSYLNEGVYICYKNIRDVKTTTNEFGKKLYSTIDKENQEIRFSFTSNDLIIDYPYLHTYYNCNNSSLFDKINGLSFSNIREIIKFNNNWVYYAESHEWEFQVTQWQLINKENGVVIKNVLEELTKTKEPGRIISIFLYMKDKNTNPYFFSFDGFQTIGSKLCINKQVDSYNNASMPMYTINFKYNKEIYDLNKYKPRSSWTDIINYLF